MGLPVAVFPGFSAGDLSTFVIRRYLQNAGYRVHRWRLGVNRGRVPALIPKVISRTEALSERVLGEDLDVIERAVEERNRIPISVPLTAIYSRRDAVVQWEACIDHYNAHCEHIEVDASHLSLGFDPRVLQLVQRAIEEASQAASVDVAAG